MRIKIVLSVLFTSSIFFLVQSTSISTAGVENGTSTTIVSETGALIAAHYVENKMFIVTNNTNHDIQIASAYIDGAAEAFIEMHSSPFLAPEGSAIFTIIGKAAELAGSSVHFSFFWNEGQAEITSILPYTIYDEEEQVEEDEIVNDESHDVTKESQTETGKEVDSEGAEREDSVVGKEEKETSDAEEVDGPVDDVAEIVAEAKAEPEPEPERSEESEVLIETTEDLEEVTDLE